jgi:hypothetical protein
VNLTPRAVDALRLLRHQLAILSMRLTQLHNVARKKVETIDTEPHGQSPAR